MLNLRKLLLIFDGFLVYCTSLLCTQFALAEQRALLIGCSNYEFLPGRDLRGPKNDVRQFAQTLITKFGFAPANVRQLVGTPDDPKLRPTRENILRELDQLAKDATEGMQIVLAFSGHGTRVPLPEGQDPFDPQNPEPDGYDEAFVAADAKLVDGEMQNLILDNEFGVRFQAMRAKGARVWALFDCCHSGSLSRGGGEDDNGEVSRELTAADLNIPKEKIQRANELDKKNRAALEANAAEPAAAKAMALVDVPNDPAAKGSFVAFFAAQPFETAPDLPCPANAPKSDENYFGLLTYTTLQTLLRQQAEHKLTYRELGQTIVARYRAERGTRGPTPNFEGDLDGEVLGLKTWPGRSKMLLQKQSNGWSINAGQLQGLTAGSIVAVYPPATVAIREQNPTGYVRVTRVTPVSAAVEPCAFEKTAAIAANKLQEAMRCEVVQRQMDEMRLQVRLVEPDSASAAVAGGLREFLGKPPEHYIDYLQLTDAPGATWQLRFVTPQEAADKYQLVIKAPQLFLIRTGEFQVTPKLPEPDKEAAPGRVWRQYDLRDTAALHKDVQADLQKIFTWQNLCRIAGGMGNELGANDETLKLELALLNGKQDRSGGKLLDRTNLQNGELLELRVSNTGADRLWVTLIFLDSNFGVTVVKTQQLDRAGNNGSELQPKRIELAATVPGPQCWLVIASSAEADHQEPDYEFLNQTGIEQDPKAPTRGGPGSTPFETLALAVAGQKGGFRDSVTAASQNPVLLMRSWMVAPIAKPTAAK